jgi:hypothetical protein
MILSGVVLPVSELFGSEVGLCGEVVVACTWMFLSGSEAYSRCCFMMAEYSLVGCQPRDLLGVRGFWYSSRCEQGVF